MLSILLMASVAGALPLEVSMSAEGGEWMFARDGQVSEVLHPDFAAGSPCHVVPQVVDTNPNATSQFTFNNTDSQSPLHLKLSVSSDSLSPSLSSVKAITLAPGGVQTIALNYNCEASEKATAHHITLLVDAGEDLLTMTYTHICNSAHISRFDYSMVTLLCLAVVLVAVSSIAVVQPKPSAIVETERTVLETKHAVGFVVVGSAVLICLFFLGQYLIYVLTVMLSFSMVTALMHAMTIIMKTLPDSLRCQGESVLPIVGATPHENLISCVISLIVLVVYLLTKHWLLNNLFGCCFVFFFLTVIKIAGFRIGALLLFLAFFYDIFWVFYSEPIFGGNVMVSVATQIDLPIKLECVRFDPLIPNQCSMLGLGDLVLPGVVIAFARVYDDVTKRCYYFLWAVVAYGIALLACGVALVMSDMPQPALLYISPCLIVALTVAGLVRGDFSKFWSGSTLKNPTNLLPAEGSLSEMRSLA